MSYSISRDRPTRGPSAWTRGSVAGIGRPLHTASRLVLWRHGTAHPDVKPLGEVALPPPFEGEHVPPWWGHVRFRAVVPPAQSLPIAHHGGTASGPGVDVIDFLGGVPASHPGTRRAPSQRCPARARTVRRALYLKVRHGSRLANSPGPRFGRGAMSTTRRAARRATQGRKGCRPPSTGLQSTDPAASPTLTHQP